MPKAPSSSTPSPLESDFGELTPVSVPRLSDTIADRVRDLVLGRDLAEGTRLPSERSLAARFGVSRPTVSQALRSLSLSGLVEIKRGSGAYVLRRKSPAEAHGGGLSAPTADNVEHMVEFRLQLERLAVEQAITRGVQARLDRVRLALARLSNSVGETSSWIAADTVFHATVVDLGDNPILTEIYERVHTSLLEYEYKEWVESDRVPAWLAPSEADHQLALHEPIVEALEQADLGAAFVALTRHHEVMRQHLLSDRARQGETR